MTDVSVVNPGLLKLRLHNLARSWGGRLARVSSDELRRLDQADRRKHYKNRRYFDAPFESSHTLGILFHEFRVLYTPGTHWAAVIHEMGHVFATRQHPGDDRCNEWDFFGWEYAVAKHIDGPLGEWENHNKDYAVVDCQEFGDLEVDKRHEVLNERWSYAMGLDLIDEDGRPQALRRGLGGV